MKKCLQSQLNITLISSKQKSVFIVMGKWLSTNQPHEKTKIQENE